ncbi:uncharacterized protein LOC109714288 isoform X3 [Ananas comosus]|uniref:Uncharacterized protein LOC109714288 isoform X3 n=1 Tax=Ananas comosus TaxID=4615 RepID=A0A6P5FLU7_ANACO|nr:uncharacterized protein LOC109714288 isoform X3 [Ananas comosus]
MNPRSVLPCVQFSLIHVNSIPRHHATSDPIHSFAPPLRSLPDSHSFDPCPASSNPPPQPPLRSLLRLFDPSSASSISLYASSYLFSRAPLPAFFPCRPAGRGGPADPRRTLSALFPICKGLLLLLPLAITRGSRNTNEATYLSYTEELAGPRALSRALAPCSMKCRGDCRALRGHRRGSLCLPAGCRLFVFLHSPYLECYMIATIELPPIFIPNNNAPFLECEMITIIERGPTFLATMKSSLAPIMKRTTELLGIKGTGRGRRVQGGVAAAAAASAGRRHVGEGRGQRLSRVRRDAPRGLPRCQGRAQRRQPLREGRARPVLRCGDQLTQASTLVPKEEEDSKRVPV